MEIGSDGQIMGTFSIEPHQDNLINQFALVILEGTIQQATETFEIIFERTPEDETELLIFKALCELKLAEQEGTNMGIKGVIDGGKK